MLPEELAREKIDKQLHNAGWGVVSREEYVSTQPLAVKESLMEGRNSNNKESDYLLFIDNKAIAVIEAKKADNLLGEDVATQAEYYASHPVSWYDLWFPHLVPLVYLANGKKIYFKNMLKPESEYCEITSMHSPKEMLHILGLKSDFGALPILKKEGLRDCQYEAILNLESLLKTGGKRGLAVLATGAGKTYLACCASYRLLTYTPFRRILFLVDRNNLARQTEAAFTGFENTLTGQSFASIYSVKRLAKNEDCNANVVISTIQKLYAVMNGETLVETDEDNEDEFTNPDIEDNTPVQLGQKIFLPSDYF